MPRCRARCRAAERDAADAEADRIAFKTAELVFCPGTDARGAAGDILRSLHGAVENTPLTTGLGASWELPQAARAAAIVNKKVWIPISCLPLGQIFLISKKKIISGQNDGDMTWAGRTRGGSNDPATSQKFSSMRKLISPMLGQNYVLLFAWLGTPDLDIAEAQGGNAATRSIIPWRAQWS